MSSETLDLYHRTSAAQARRIEENGYWVSLENTQEAYFSDRVDGHANGYGVAIVHVRVPAGLAELEDEFPDGERHYRVKVAALRPEDIVVDQ